jgi:formamidopyrimidine-DNA glycosylase
MPEAAEVETLRRQLRAHLPLTIQSVDVRGHRTVRAHAPNVMQALVGATITTTTRRGKWLGLAGEGAGVKMHLRMSGRLHLFEPDVELTRHDHVVLQVSCPEGERSLRFFDPRTFGEVALWRGEPLGTAVPDVLESELLDEAVQRFVSGRTTKAVLLDQAGVMQGLGNIYADELCHMSHILPSTPWNALSEAQRSAIANLVPELIEQATLNRGTALADEGWLDLYAEIGGHGPSLRVHGKRQCSDCGGSVVREKVTGRSTYWCPDCLRGPSGTKHLKLPVGPQGSTSDSHPS